MKIHKWSAIPAAVALAILLGSTAGATQYTIQRHFGTSDPLTENFGYWPYNGGISTLAIADDNGFATWQVQNTGASQQAAYMQLGGTGPYGPGSGLTQGQVNDINANGFALSLQARVVAGPVYEEGGSQLISGVASVAGFSGYRFDIGLGLDAQGDTVVVVPELISYSGAEFHYDPYGSVVVVPGNDYHLYQLAYDPSSATASLLIDGVVEATGYPGSAVAGGAVANNFGLAFGSLNLSTCNFADVHLESEHVSAAATFRNGGTNPASHTALALPLIGGTYSCSVDLSTTGHPAATVLGYLSPLDVTIGSGQTILINIADPAGEVLHKRFKLGPTAVFHVPVPNDPAFSGLMVHTQAVHVGGSLPWAASNALDLRLGY